MSVDRIYVGKGGLLAGVQSGECGGGGGGGEGIRRGMDVWMWWWCNEGLSDGGVTGMYGVLLRS